MVGMYGHTDYVATMDICKKYPVLSLARLLGFYMYKKLNLCCLYKTKYRKLVPSSDEV